MLISADTNWNMENIWMYVLWFIKAHTWIFIYHLHKNRTFFLIDERNETINKFSIGQLREIDIDRWNQLVFIEGGWRAPKNDFFLEIAGPSPLLNSVFIIKKNNKILNRGVQLKLVSGPQFNFFAIIGAIFC